MECSEQIECLNENFENYIQAFINLCAVATKEINVYTQHFVDITKSILNKYYTTFYECIGLSFWTLKVSNIKEISELIHNEINIYIENNVFNFFKEELRYLDNN